MYELIKVGSRTYYIDCPVKMGIYQLSDKEVCLIDTGNDKEAGRKIWKVIEEQGWDLKCIINTHAHADHIGGNQFLQKKANCPIYIPEKEMVFTKYPELEAAFLYGGYPDKTLRNKAFMAKPSETTALTKENVPEGLEIIELPGHFLGMIGLRTSDDVVFLADSVISEDTLNKYHVPFLYDVKASLETWDAISSMKASVFIPSHAPETKEIKYLSEQNKRKVLEVLERILEFCKTPLCFEDVLQNIFQSYKLELNLNQYVLVGTTIRSMLSYLKEEKSIENEICNCKLLWKTI